MQNPNEAIWTRTRNLLAYIALPQQTRPPRTPVKKYSGTKKCALCWEKFRHGFVFKQCMRYHRTSKISPQYCRVVPLEFNGDVLGGKRSVVNVWKTGLGVSFFMTVS
jgi:hypothetical protein